MTGYRSALYDLRYHLIAVGLAFVVGIGIGDCQRRGAHEAQEIQQADELGDDHNLPPLEEPR